MSYTETQDVVEAIIASAQANINTYLEDIRTQRTLTTADLPDLNGFQQSREYDNNTYDNPVIYIFQGEQSAVERNQGDRQLTNYRFGVSVKLNPMNNTTALRQQNYYLDAIKRWILVNLGGNDAFAEFEGSTIDQSNQTYKMLYITFLVLAEEVYC